MKFGLPFEKLEKGYLAPSLRGRLQCPAISYSTLLRKAFIVVRILIGKHLRKYGYKQ